MRIARRLGWWSLFAGMTTYLAARAALGRRDRQRRLEIEERTRWETDGGATVSGPQAPGTPMQEQASSDAAAGPAATT